MYSKHPINQPNDAACGTLPCRHCMCCTCLSAWSRAVDELHDTQPSSVLSLQTTCMPSSEASSPQPINARVPQNRTPALPDQHFVPFSRVGVLSSARPARSFSIYSNPSMHAPTRHQGLLLSPAVLSRTPVGLTHQLRL